MCLVARRRMASSKMKRMKQSGCKDQEELDEDNEELFAELGITVSFSSPKHWHLYVALAEQAKRICITLPVESAPFFIPSTSFCSLSSWFTSSCAYHLITVTTFALTFHSRLNKLISFTNPFLHSLLIPSGRPSQILNLYWTNWALAFFLFQFRVLD